MEPTREQTGDYVIDPTPDPITVTVADAAKLLGLSSEAVRMRVKRGTLASTKVAGTIYILLEQTDPQPNDGPNDQPNGRPNNKPNGRPNDQTALVSSLEDQVSYLRQQLATRDEEIRRRDHLLAAALKRLPELEAPSGSRGGRLAAADEPERVNPHSATEGAQAGSKPRSWWRRIFEG